MFLHHEDAFVGTRAVVAALRRQFEARSGGVPWIGIPVADRQLSMRDAVRSCLCNSQLVTVTPNRRALIAPASCLEAPRAHRFVQDLVERGDTPIQEAHFFDLRESLRNGGGPACLRSRVVLTDTERRALPSGVGFDPVRHALLSRWVRKHHRERLAPKDLADPQLLEESRRALDEFTSLPGLGSIYPFQLVGSGCARGNERSRAG